MASTRDRQRKMARAKLDRQMARRAARTRRQRRIQAGVGAAVALVLIVVGSVWLTGGFDRKPQEETAAEDVCTWMPQDATANDKLKEAGKPATAGLPTSGTRALTITTNQGKPITVSLDLTSAPCGGASLAHLASRGFFDNTSCHEITADRALRCGDPSGTGLGGPTYSFGSENEPSAPQPDPNASAAPKQPALYPKGTMALIAPTPGAYGSQFLLFLSDASPKDAAYSIVGTVTGGPDVLNKIGKIPTVDNGSGKKIKPKNQVILQSVTIGEVTPPGAPETPPSGAPSATPSTSRQP